MLCPLYVIRIDEMASHSLPGALPTGNDHLSKRTFYRSRFWLDFHIALKGLGLGLWYNSTISQELSSIDLRCNTLIGLKAIS